MNDTNNFHVAQHGDMPRQDAAIGDETRQGTASLDQSERIATPVQDEAAQMNGSRSTANDTPTDENSGYHDITRQDTTNPGKSRHDANLPGTPGHATAKHDETGHDAPIDESVVEGGMQNQQTVEGSNDDIERPSEKYSPRQIADWVDIEETDRLLREHGIARNIRTIQRMCKRGDLVARLVPTENGVRYLIERGSIDEFVDRHNQIMPTGKGSDEELGVQKAPSETMSPRGVLQTISQEANGNHADPVATDNAHAREILAIKDEQISFLKTQLDIANRQIEVKDEQINTMLERDHETNVLIQNLQNLMALPEGRKNKGWQAGD